MHMFQRPMIDAPPPASTRDALWGNSAMQTATISSPRIHPTLVRRLPLPSVPSAESQSPPQGPHDLFTSSPVYPKFQAGYQWYPGVTIGGAFMSNKQGMGATGFGLPRLTPPVVQRVGAIASRSVRMGAIDNARRSGSGGNLLTRIINPPTSRR